MSQQKLEPDQDGDDDGEYDDDNYDDDYEDDEHEPEQLSLDRPEENKAQDRYAPVKGSNRENEFNILQDDNEEDEEYDGF